MKFNFKEKLTSRKFWAAIIGVVLNVCVIFGVPDMTTQQIVALVSTSSTLIAYIIGQGMVDSSKAAPATTIAVLPIPIASETAPIPKDGGGQ